MPTRQRKPLAKWQQDRLDDKIETTRRAAVLDQCRRCGRPVWRGPDADMSAIGAVADAEPLDAVAEVIAYVSGRCTYDAIPSAGKTHLHYRDPHTHMRHHDWPVYAAHRCEEKTP